MRILLDPGVYTLRNKGNIAMMQVAVNRVRNLWPSATIGVITISPNILSNYCDGVVAVGPTEGADWGTVSPSGMSQSMPKSLRRLLLEFREEAWARKQRAAQRGAGSSTPQEPVQTDHNREAPIEEVTVTWSDPTDAPVAAVQSADLVIATGGGILCDIAKKYALPVLDRIHAAIEQGKPTAMMGQQMGPFQDPELYAHVRAVLPHVGLIAIRDGLTGPELLADMGVEPSRIVSTGDDAIELVYQARSANIGKGIGVSLRVASYNAVDEQDIVTLRTVLQAIAAAHNAPIVSLPIGHALHEPDAEMNQRLMAGYAHVVNAPRSRFADPSEVIAAVGRCRVVVTAAFHAGVFALSQGIPVVGIVRSRTYTDKFVNLAANFGEGCIVVALDDPDLEATLKQAVEKAWASAEQWRPQLLKAAERQIAAGQAAYARLPELLSTTAVRP